MKGEALTKSRTVETISAVITQHNFTLVENKVDSPAVLGGQGREAEFFCHRPKLRLTES
jgi:hypothetical protein